MDGPYRKDDPAFLHQLTEFDNALIAFEDEANSNDLPVMLTEKERKRLTVIHRRLGVWLAIAKGKPLTDIVNI